MDKFIIKSLKVDKFIIKVDEFIAKDVCVKKVLRGGVCYYLNPQVDEFNPLRDKRVHSIRIPWCSSSP